ncbi:MAG TPA: hypothetical protein VEY07_01210 [Thermoplasmata archaeon]|nr:hypothetical protein [Thermoplasmata archaeon]
MPARAGAGPPAEPADARYRRAAPESVAEAVHRLTDRGRDEFPTQQALLTAVRRELVRSDPALRIGPRRLRRLLLDSGLARLRVDYSERQDRRPLERCPVCGDSLRRVVNRTLEGDRVVLGYACSRCAYWTHLRRRVPIRYSVRLLRGRREPVRSSG